jgi:hypothetical protein
VALGLCVGAGLRAQAMGLPPLPARRAAALCLEPIIQASTVSPMLSMWAIRRDLDVRCHASGRPPVLSLSLSLPPSRVVDSVIKGSSDAPTCFRSPSQPVVWNTPPGARRERLV